MKKIIDQNKAGTEISNPEEKVKWYGKLYIASLNNKVIENSAEDEFFFNEFGDNVPGYRASVLTETGDSSENRWIPSILTPEDEKSLYDAYY